MLKISPSGTLGSYDFWNAIVYFFTGKSALSLIFINSLVGSLTIIFVYQITKQLCNRKAAVFASFLVGFWPSSFLWSIQNLKEPLSIFLIVVIIWALVKLRMQFRFYLVALLVLASIALKELRIAIFLVFYGIVFPVSLILFLWRRNRVLFVLLLIGLGSGIIMLVANYLLKFLPQNQNIFSLLEYINYLRTVRAYGRTAFLSGVDITQPLTLIFFTPAAILVAWLAPFPWQFGSMSQIMAIPEMLLYYLLLPAMFMGCKFIMQERMKEGGFVLIYIFIMMLVMAFVEGNIGTLFRHRAVVLPFMFILAAIGLERMKFKISFHT